MITTDQQIAIAEACGWTCTKTIYNPNPTPYGRHPIHTADVTWDLPLSDYLSDLNAMHEAEKVLNAGQINSYLRHLYHFTKVAQVGSNPWEIIAARVAVHATASQRAEAFLKTLNLWKEN
jgi:hypothetical protein